MQLSYYAGFLLNARGGVSFSSYTLVFYKQQGSGVRGQLLRTTTRFELAKLLKSWLVDILKFSFWSYFQINCCSEGSTAK